MTEIKFRGKTVGTEEWIYGSLLIKCGSYYINEGKPLGNLCAGMRERWYDV